MTNPYQVLGVSPSATDEEIKQAYRALARKYHPDKYRDSDLADLAEEKMKEINAAYEQIQKERSYRAGGSTAGSDGAQSSSQSGSPRFKEIRIMINQGDIRSAERALYAMPESAHNAEWFFLMGCVMMKKGYFLDAQKMLDRACSMDPYNMEYRNARDQMANRANGYGGGYRQTTGTTGCCDGSDFCCNLLLCDCCCECMGGDLIRCC